MKMKNSTILTTMALGLATAIFPACNPNNKAKENSSKLAHVKAEQPHNIPYTLSSGIKMNLPDELLEISGIAFIAGQDEITEKENIKTVVEQKNLLPKGEYEGLFVDRESNQAYVLCKECKVDRKQAQTSGYIFNMDENGQLQPKGEFAIQLDELKEFDPTIKKTFKPSALAKKADSKEWYILSSIDKALVVTDENFHVKSLHSLDPKMFPQPEGINFDSKFNLYISSEAGHQDKGLIYKFEKQ
ncbi:hypothetical protein [Sphingobacterium sp.]|uniref:hypothetical protein n=1 Tax=Sphingobacterium sp. TaxID=341027 RepID=UPI002897C272|nr:hypothetical protein [Sphingobacterium sp.]